MHARVRSCVRSFVRSFVRAIYRTNRNSASENPNPQRHDTTQHNNYRGVSACSVFGGSFKKCNGAAFVRSFVRSFVRVLGPLDRREQVHRAACFCHETSHPDGLLERNGNHGITQLVRQYE
eukprot:jgi/Psemu1/322201/estExt_fgenesh1_pg.C_220001